MTMQNRTVWGRIGLGVACAALLGVCGLGALATAQPDATKPAAKQDTSKLEKRDLVIFKNGRQVEGVVLEENDASIKMLVIVGSLRSETTYTKAEILEIKHNEFKPAAETKPADKAEEKPAESAVAKSEDSASPTEGVVDVNGKPIPAGTLKVYVVPFGGEFGRDVSKTPVKVVMDDIVKVQPDILVFKFDFTYGVYGQQQEDFQLGVRMYDQLEKARELDTLISDRLDSDPNLTKKPRVVAWINKKAMGGSAFLAMTFTDIYFATDGHMGGIGGLETMFEGVGDEVVREKQRSLRLGRAKGMAAKGKHDERIMTAMSRGDYILCYRIVGGQVEWLENQMPPSPEWFLLKDDGAVNKDHTDTMQDIVRMKGNDYLVLDAKTAFDVNFSRGTADTFDELMDKMGVRRNYAQVKNKTSQVFKEWSANVTKTEKEITKLIREFREVQVKQPGGYDQRTEARGRQIHILQQIQSIVKTYMEAINPRRLDPEGLLEQIDITIDRIKTAQQLDRRP